MSKGFFYLVSCAIFVWSCSDSGGPGGDNLAAMERSTIEAFISANELDATRNDAGFYFVIIDEVPTGKTQAEGSILGIYYSMSILDGDEISFYNSGNGAPLRLKQGASAVVPVGLDEGLGLMREGETYRFILPSELAYGDLEFSSLIPANSIIDVEVELVSIEDENDIILQEIDAINSYISSNNLNNLTINPLDSVVVRSSQLRYKRKTAGGAGVRPANGDSVVITYTGTFLNDTQFDATTGNDTFNFTLGSGEVLEGLDEGIAQMEVGEQALLIMPSSIGYGESARVIPDFLINDMIERQVVPDYVSQVPPYEVLLFDVRLVQ